MAALYGIMGLNDVKNLTVNDVGQRLVFDAIGQLLGQYNEALNEMQTFFVQGETTDPQITYMLPSGGMMQESTELSRPGAVRPQPGIPVGFEIRDARDQVAWDDVALAYATVEAVQATVDNVMIRHTNWVRYHLMRAVFNNASHTYMDPLLGAITVKPLANGDADLYPPIIGGSDNITDNHYIASDMAGLADATNPFPAYFEEIAEHTGGGNIVALLNPAEVEDARNMAAFVDVADPGLRVMQGVEAVYSGAAVPGTIVGRLGETWISSWRWMPAGYIFMRDMEAPAPLLKRIDRVMLPGRGELALIATQQEFPFLESFWRDRHGYGVANRLNGLVGQITGDTYAVPTLYA